MKIGVSYYHFIQKNKIHFVFDLNEAEIQNPNRRVVSFLLSLFIFFLLFVSFFHIRFIFEYSLLDLI